MEEIKKERKRSNSFKNIFKGTLFRKDKKNKKPENVQTQLTPNQGPSKYHIKTNEINEDIKEISELELENKYAEMHINRYNNIREQFEIGVVSNQINFHKEPRNAIETKDNELNIEDKLNELTFTKNAAINETLNNSITEDPISINSNTRFPDNYELPHNRSTSSLEQSKLVLPTNRDRIVLQPRIISPTRPNKINDKESLPSHQRLEIDIDYPDNKNSIYQTKFCGNNEMCPQIINNDEASKTSLPFVQTNNYRIEDNLQYNQNTTPLVNNSPPTRSIISLNSPPKQEIRKSVEAYCWKELKKLKEYEDYQLQLQMNTTYYDDSNLHRSRSMSSRNSRRSSSVPRDPNKHQRQVEPVYGTNRNPNQMQERIQYNSDYARNLTQRSMSNANRFGNNASIQRPIFNRGSLTQPKQLESRLIYSKKVNFHSPQNVDDPRTWPTKNGFTQQPPQRKISHEFGINEDLFDGGNVQQNIGIPTNQSREPIYGVRPMPNIRKLEPIATNNESISPNQYREPIYGARQMANIRIITQSPTNIEAISPNQYREPIYGARQMSNIRIITQSPTNIEAISPNLYREPIYGTRPMQPNMRIIEQNPNNEAMAINQHREPIYGTRPMPPNIRKMDQSPNNEAISPNQMREPIYGARQMPPNIRKIGQIPNEAISPNQFREPIYGTRPMPPNNRKIEQENSPTNKEAPNRYREPIYGTRPMPSNIRKNDPNFNKEAMISPNHNRYDYPSNENEPPYHNKYNEPVYVTKKNTINNKVCDIYGRIHENSVVDVTYPAMPKSGVLYGHLRRNSNAPPMQYQSYNQLQPNNFQRGSRLTASVNDMHNRYRSGFRPNLQPLIDAPTRPLPPIPNESKSFYSIRR